jgi:hypothetical protein
MQGSQVSESVEKNCRSYKWFYSLAVRIKYALLCRVESDSSSYVSPFNFEDVLNSKIAKRSNQAGSKQKSEAFASTQLKLSWIDKQKIQSRNRAKLSTKLKVIVNVILSTMKKWPLEERVDGDVLSESVRILFEV